MVSARIDQTAISIRPECARSGRQTAVVFDARNQNEKARIGTIVGRTIASMIPTETIRIGFSAAPIGPRGSRMFITRIELMIHTNPMRKLPLDLPIAKAGIEY